MRLNEKKCPHQYMLHTAGLQRESRFEMLMDESRKDGRQATDAYLYYKFIYEPSAQLRYCMVVRTYSKRMYNHPDPQGVHVFRFITYSLISVYTIV